MTINTYNFTDGDLQVIANQIKELLLDAFENEGLITNGDEIASQYAIVVVQRNWLGALIEKILPPLISKGEARLEVVKLVDRRKISRI